MAMDTIEVGIDRDIEMQAEIAVKNEEARLKEQELAKQISGKYI